MIQLNITSIKAAYVKVYDKSINHLHHSYVIQRHALPYQFAPYGPDPINY